MGMLTPVPGHPRTWARGDRLGEGLAEAMQQSGQAGASLCLLCPGLHVPRQ